MTMSEKRLYPLAVLDEATQKKMAEYYALLTEQGYIGRQTKDIPYHFTLGDTDTANEASLLQQAEKICTETSPITFRMDHVSLFGQSVLFLSPNMNIEMLEMQSRFFPGYGKGYNPWTAHATILMEEPEVILASVPIITEHFKAFEAQIVAVAVYEFFPTRHIKTFQLGGTK
jgi:2'-5' RNA ligase